MRRPLMRPLMCETGRALRVAACLAAILLPALQTAAGSVVTRDPFQRPAEAAADSPENPADSLRMAGSVRAADRVWALLVGPDGIGRIVQEGTLMPLVGVRVLAITDRSVRVASVDAGVERVVSLESAERVTELGAGTDR